MLRVPIKLRMLTRIYPWHRFLFPRYYKDKSTKKVDKAFKNKGRSEENRYFVREHAEQIHNLQNYLERIEKRQKKLLNEMEEATRILHELEKEEGPTSEPIDLDEGPPKNKNKP